MNKVFCKYFVTLDPYQKEAPVKESQPKNTIIGQEPVLISMQWIYICYTDPK